MTIMMMVLAGVVVLVVLVLMNTLPINRLLVMSMATYSCVGLLVVIVQSYFPRDPGSRVCDITGCTMGCNHGVLCGVCPPSDFCCWHRLARLRVGHRGCVGADPNVVDV